MKQNGEIDKILGGLGMASLALYRAIAAQVAIITVAAIVHFAVA